ncbi:hypothetical protein [Streptomyces sp. NPDC014733]|uniref:hypothetical protein n=1 Tax=Streptomyces sp. NPDC014733 TaxID=3364885 RepID=UPI0036FB90B4
MTWTEAEYHACLAGERQLYAWVLHRYGDRTPEEAQTAALGRYPYEPAGAPLRGLIFHDEAWHWAMLTLHGECYWIRHPELAGPPPEYRELAREL